VCQAQRRWLCPCRQLRAGAELRFRLASQRLADERSLLLSPRCVRSSTSSFHSGLSRSARLTTRTIPVNNAGSAQASKLAAMWWAPYPLRLLGLVRTLPSVPRPSHYGGSPLQLAPVWDSGWGKHTANDSSGRVHRLQSSPPHLTKTCGYSCGYVRRTSHNFT